MKRYLTLASIVVLSAWVALWGVQPPQPAHAAFPSVAQTQTSTDDSNDTDQTFSLPTGVTEGNLLIVVMGVDGSGETITWDQGWTQFFYNDRTDITTMAAWKEAGASEPSTYTVVSAGIERNGAVVYEISGAADPSTDPPEGGGATNGDGSGNAPDPDSYTASWGAEDNLWIFATGVDSDNTPPNISVFPSGYTNEAQIYGSGAGRSGAAAATREVNAASEDPGTATFSHADAWAAGTLVVRPAAEGGEPDPAPAQPWWPFWWRWW